MYPTVWYYIRLFFSETPYEIVNYWKQPECPSTVTGEINYGRLHKKYYAAIKKKLEDMRWSLRCIVRWKKQDACRTVCLMCFLLCKNRNRKTMTISLHICFYLHKPSISGRFCKKQEILGAFGEGKGWTAWERNFLQYKFENIWILNLRNLILNENKIFSIKITYCKLNI